MKAVVCYKWVVDEADITVNAATRELNTASASRKISLYDKNAIEMAVKLVEANGGECISLSTGAEGADKSKKDILSRGMTEGIFVQDAAMADADTNAIAKVLAAKIGQIGDVDIVVCGEGASDDYSQQVGPRIAGILGWPVVTYAKEVTIEGDKAIVKRVVEEGIETIEATLPVAVTALGDCNVPRIPMMRDILSASKKPYAAGDLATNGIDGALATPAVKTLSVKGNTTDRKKIMLTGSAQEVAEELIRNLLADGAL